MAFSSHRKMFKGTLANVPVDALKDLDYELETLAERKKFIDKKYLDVAKFHEIYVGGTETEEYYKVGLNKDDDLSQDINIFKYIENDGSYLLNSRDIPRDRQQQYKILSEEEFKIIERMEKSMNELGIIKDSDAESEVMIIIDPKHGNDYTNLEHKLVKEDFEDFRTGQVLRDYDKLRTVLKSEMEKIKNKQPSKYNLYQLKKLLRDVNDDMIRAKIQLRGIRNPAKKLGDESGKFDTELIDYGNPKVIDCILKNVKLGDLRPDSELSHIAYDIEQAIDYLTKENHLDSTDLEIIECYNNNYSKVNIAKEINRDEKVVRRRIKRICNKISLFLKKVDLKCPKNTQKITIYSVGVQNQNS